MKFKIFSLKKKALLILLIISEFFLINALAVRAQQSLDKDVYTVFVFLLKEQYDDASQRYKAEELVI